MILTCDEVNNLIKERKCVLFDIRDEADFSEGHIPGAVNCTDIFFYLSESTDKGLKEMHDFFTGLFSKAGLTKDKTAIIYEYSLDSQYGGSCRGYWLLQYLGHKNAGILEGGFKLWNKMNFPVSTTETRRITSKFTPVINQKLIATKTDVLNAIEDKKTILLDNRDKCEWVGESSSPYGIDFAPRKGRLPGAIWIEWYNFMNYPGQHPTFKTKEEIISLCSSNGISSSDNIIIYCFKGARASNTYIALKLAGFKKIRIYFAGWNEWSRDFSLPIDDSKI